MVVNNIYIIWVFIFILSILNITILVSRVMNILKYPEINSMLTKEEKIFYIINISYFLTYIVWLIK